MANNHWVSGFVRYDACFPDLEFLQSSPLILIFFRSVEGGLFQHDLKCEVRIHCFPIVIFVLFLSYYILWILRSHLLVFSLFFYFSERLKFTKLHELDYEDKLQRLRNICCLVTFSASQLGCSILCFSLCFLFLKTPEI